MENFWTSNKPISGLRHFVLLNKKKENNQITFLMVSVLDAAIYLEISYEELVNSNNWEEGWIDLPKGESITETYVRHKSLHKDEQNNDVFVSDDSLFNIS